MNKLSEWVFAKNIEVEKNTEGQFVGYPFSVFRDAMPNEVDEYVSLYSSIQPYYNAYDFFVPIDINFKALFKATIGVHKDAFKGENQADIDDKVSVLVGNYISSYQALLAYWKTFAKKTFAGNFTQENPKTNCFEDVLTILTTGPLMKVLRNYLAHSSRLPMHCGTSLQPGENEIHYSLWINRDVMLQGCKRNGDDRTTLINLHSSFDLLPILIKSKTEIEQAQFSLYKKLLMSDHALDLRNKIHEMQYRFNLENEKFYLIKSTSFEPVSTEDGKGYYIQDRFSYVEIPWGIVRLIDHFNNE